MFKHYSLLLACFSAPVLAVIIPSGKNATSDLAKRTTITTSTTGTVDDTWYSLYIEENTGASMTIDASNQFSVTWESSAVDMVAGIGWPTGSAQAITYSGSLNVESGITYLSVYGWFTNPLVEYYICDYWTDYNPGSEGSVVGTVTSDGGTYTVYLATRTDAPSIEGTQTFHQYISVRTSGRIGGTVTTANHFDQWQALGLELGTFNEQILAVEGYESSGSASFTVE